MGFIITTLSSIVFISPEDVEPSIKIRWCGEPGWKSASTNCFKQVNNYQGSSSPQENWSMVVGEEFGVVFMVLRKDRSAVQDAKYLFRVHPVHHSGRVLELFWRYPIIHSHGSFQKKKNLLKGIVLGNQWCNFNAVAKTNAMKVAMTIQIKQYL